MADIKATYISNGTDKAYFLDSMKMEDPGTLVLYSSLKPEIESRVTIPTYGSAVSNYHPDNVVLFDSVCPLADRANCTDTLQNLAYNLSAVGGGTIKFGSSQYFIKNIDLPSNITLQGEGVGKTVIVRITSSEVLGTVDSNGSKGFIHIGDAHSWYPRPPLKGKYIAK